MFRRIRFLFRLIVAVVAAMLMYSLCGVQNINKIAENENLPDFDYYSYAKKQWEQGNDFSALAALEYVVENKLGDSAACGELYNSYLKQIAERKSAKGRVIAVGKGFITGKADGIDSLSGSVLGDLLVYGDIRDIVRESFFEDETDSFVVAFSSIGLLTSAFPPADVSASALKVLKKTGSLSKPMCDAFQNTVKTALKAPKSEAANIVKEGIVPVSDLWKNSHSFGQFSLVMKNAKDMAAVKYFTRLLKQNPANAKKLEKVLALGGDYSQEVFDFVAKNGQRGMDAAYGALRKGPAAMALAARHPKAFSLFAKNSVKSFSALKGYVKDQLAYAVFRYGEIFRWGAFFVLSIILSFVLLPRKYLAESLKDENGKKSKTFSRMAVVYVFCAVFFAGVIVLLFAYLKNPQQNTANAASPLAFSGQSPWNVQIDILEDHFLNESMSKKTSAISVGIRGKSYIAVSFKSLGLDWREIGKGGVYSLSVLARRQCTTKTLSFKATKLLLCGENFDYILIEIPQQMAKMSPELELAMAPTAKTASVLYASGLIKENFAELYPLSGSVYGVSGGNLEGCALFSGEKFYGIVGILDGKAALDFLSKELNGSKFMEIPLTKTESATYYTDFMQAVLKCQKLREAKK